MSHRYPTRFQSKLRATQEKTALKETITYTRNALIAIERVNCFHCKIEESIKLFDHLYKNPILLTGHERVREKTWNKMNEIEKTLLSTIQQMPARLTANSKYDMTIRYRIPYLLSVMEAIRMKYW